MLRDNAFAFVIVSLIKMNCPFKSSCNPHSAEMLFQKLFPKRTLLLIFLQLTVCQTSESSSWYFRNFKYTSMLYYVELLMRGRGYENSTPSLTWPERGLLNPDDPGVQNWPRHVWVNSEAASTDEMTRRWKGGCHKCMNKWVSVFSDTLPNISLKTFYLW